MLFHIGLYLCCFNSFDYPTCWSRKTTQPVHIYPASLQQACPERWLAYTRQVHFGASRDCSWGWVPLWCLGEPPWLKKHQWLTDVFGRLWQIYHDRRKFRSQFFDNIDRWKSRGGKSQKTISMTFSHWNTMRFPRTHLGSALRSPSPGVASWRGRSCCGAAWWPMRSPWSAWCCRPWTRWKDESWRTLGISGFSYGFSYGNHGFSYDFPWSFRKIRGIYRLDGFSMIFRKGF